MRFLLLLSVLLTSFVLIAQKSAKGTKVNVQVEGLTASKAYLIGVLGDQFYRADSSQVGPGGTFQFIRDEPLDPGFYYIHDGASIAIQMLIDEDQEFSLKTKANDLVRSMQVEGSLDNELLYENLKFENAQKLCQQ